MRALSERVSLLNGVAREKGTWSAVALGTRSRAIRERVPIATARPGSKERERTI